MTVESLLPYITAIVAVLGLVYARVSSHRDEASGTQAIRDKLDYISDTARDTREDVRALDRKLDDHANRLARVEEHVKDHERRIENLES